VVNRIICARLGTAKATIRDHGVLGADYARRPRAAARELPRGSFEPRVTQPIGNDWSWSQAEWLVSAREKSKRTIEALTKRLQGSADRRTR